MRRYQTKQVARRFFHVSVLLVAALLGIGASLDAQSNTRIVPGFSIGPIHLRMTLDQAIRAMGRGPDGRRSGFVPPGYPVTEDVFVWELSRLRHPSASRRRTPFQLPRPGELEVRIKRSPGSRIHSISTDARGFKTKGGNGPGSTADSFLREFGHPDKRETLGGPTSISYSYYREGLALIAEDNQVWDVIVFEPSTR